jgi:hypothetical protein
VPDVSGLSVLSGDHLSVDRCRVDRCPARRENSLGRARAHVGSVVRDGIRPLRRIVADVGRVGIAAGAGTGRGGITVKAGAARLRAFKRVAGRARSAGSGRLVGQD